MARVQVGVNDPQLAVGVFGGRSLDGTEAAYARDPALTLSQFAAIYDGLRLL